ncbi:MAG: glycoside hydrolase family 65 protein [Solirubrobacterales bacterium]
MERVHAVYEIENPSLDNYNILLNEAIFHNANGYIGIRYDFEEGYPKDYKYTRSQYINGFYDFMEMKQPEGLYGLAKRKQIMLNVADTQSIRLFAEGEEFSMYEGTLLGSKLTLDMDKGITVREVIWRSPKGLELSLKITRMTSFYQLSLFTIDYEIEPLNFSGDIVIKSAHTGDVVNYFDLSDPRLNNDQIKMISPVNCNIVKGASLVTSRAEHSGLLVSSCVKHELCTKFLQDYCADEKGAVWVLKTRAEKNEKIRFVKYSVFCDSVRFENTREQVLSKLENAVSLTMEDLYEKQQKYLRNYWNNCFVEVEGQNELNNELKYKMYQLIQAAGKDQYCNVSPRGLSGDGYGGHYFWDTEMYVLPFFTITNPSISKKLIEYRYEILDKARENARIMGHLRGALYPWRTIMGEECSGYFPAGSAQYHINSDIAYSIIAYYLATKDIEFIKSIGAEIIFETARIWLETGNYYEDKFHINDVTGPDEYSCIVNNNYYTNIMAKHHMNWAVKIYNMIKGEDGFHILVEKIGLLEHEIEEFKKASDSMYLPYDEKLRINPQDDSFLKKRKWDLRSIPKDKFPLFMHYHPLHLYRHQICKQADTVMAYFVLEDGQSEETMINSFNYYEEITTHDSSLSKCIFSIMASRLGMKEKAFAYFQDSAKMDLTDQRKDTKDGIHIANIAGDYMTIIYGFGGFRLKESGISFAPILPEEWSGYKFLIKYEDSRLMVTVNRNQCVFEIEKGSSKKIIVYGKEYLLEKRLVINDIQI